MNRHGLTRDIPEAVKRVIRQRDGFGCVICGKAIYDYEHFDPEYADAKVHDPNGIVFLCIEHHGLKTRKLLSKDAIQRHASNPKCKELGFSFGPFDVGTLYPEIIMGELTCVDVRCLISLDGEEIFTVSPPTKLGLPFRINASLKDPNGDNMLKIVDNEWRTDSTNWDVEVSGSTISIRSAPRKVTLVLRSEPPKKIIVERLEMNHNGHKIICTEGGAFEILTVGGSKFRAVATTVSGFDTAIEVINGIMSVGISRSKFPINFGFTGIKNLGARRRNSNCHCGSGMRYKHCHGRL